MRRRGATDQAVILMADIVYAVPSTKSSGLAVNRRHGINANGVTLPDSSERFKETAREIGADQSSEEFDRIIGEMGRSEQKKRD